MNEININDYQNLIHLIISKFKTNSKDELFNECYLKLHHLKNSFNPTKSTFETYAFKHLYFTCKHFLESNQLNHQSLDELAYNEENEEVRKIDLLESELNLELEISKKNYLENHNLQLSETEKFIQEKYYVDNLSVKKIIKVYQPFHLIKSEKTIRRILNK